MDEIAGHINVSVSLGIRAIATYISYDISCLIYLYKTFKAQIFIYRMNTFNSCT